VEHYSNFDSPIFSNRSEILMKVRGVSFDLFIDDVQGFPIGDSSRLVALASPGQYWAKQL
jgi:hypothetical protein